MKKIIGLVVALSIFNLSFASGSATDLTFNMPAKQNAAHIFIPIGKDGQKISLLELSKIKVKDFETLTGRQLKFSDKLKFKIGQKQLANSIHADGTINNKKLANLNTTKRATEQSRKYLRIWLVLLAASIILYLLSLAISFLWILGLLASLGAAVFFVLWIIELSKS